MEKNIAAMGEYKVNIKIIIPARYKSSRFPGKPLIDLNGKSMLQRVWENCCDALSEEDVYVATEDNIIKEHCKEKNMRVIMTSDSCPTGTDRVFEASQHLNADLLVNVQGDLPLVYGPSIKKIIDSALEEPDIIHYGMNKIDEEKDFRDFSISKVVSDINNYLLYVSRSSIPITKLNVFKEAFKTASVFILPKNILKSFYNQGRKGKTPLESIEDIEILRFLELGYKVKMVEIFDKSISIDLSDHVSIVVNILKEKENNERHS